MRVISQARGDIFEGGAVTGFVGGALFGLLLMIVYYSIGLGFWFPMKLIAASVYGIQALVGSGSVILTGIIIHLILSVSFGMLFSAMTSDEVSIGGSILEGPIF